MARCGTEVVVPLCLVRAFSWESGCDRSYRLEADIETATSSCVNALLSGLVFGFFHAS